MTQRTSRSRATSRIRARTLLVAAATALAAAAIPALATRADAVDHLVISEIATGGASASDEFIEILNPSVGPVPLEGLELVYASASGATISGRAAWGAGSPALAPGGRLLVANEAGVHAPGADFRYAGGMSATAGSVVLRSAASGVVVDAVAWGAATGSWLEGTPATPPAPGESIARLASSDGVAQDTDDNAADFAALPMPTPEGGALVPVPTPLPSPTPPPSSVPSAAVTTSPSPAGSPTSDPRVVSIAAARSAADGGVVTVEGTSLTASSFHDGGGYVADDTGGIAVLTEGAAFGAGVRLRVTGTVESRFAQRTIRAAAAGIAVLGDGAEPPAAPSTTGQIGEPTEGGLVRIEGIVRGTPTVLTSGVAFDLDDGSGPVRVLVQTASGIDVAEWTAGSAVDLVGVAGQRDSSGTGRSGYRVLPRGPADVVRVTPPAAATPAPEPSATNGGRPSPTPAQRLVQSIASARDAQPGAAVVVRGAVTMPVGVVEAATMVIQDETAAIVVRVDDDPAEVALGDLVEVSGVRSTRSGMETVRATAPIVVLDGPMSVHASPVTGGATWEDLEAELVSVRGRLVASARRASSGTVSFDVTGDHGIVRVVIPAALQADDSALVEGVSVEVVGVVGQETTGVEPLAGYRLWPRTASDVRLLGGPPNAGTERAPRTGGSAGAQRGDTGGVAAGSFPVLGGPVLSEVRIGATLVASEWPTLGIAGVLWDGKGLVALSAESTAAVEALGAPPPLPVVASGLRVVGTEPLTGVSIVVLSTEAGDLAPAAGGPAAPRTTMPAAGDPPAWVSVVGRVVEGAARPRLETADGWVALELACADPIGLPDGAVAVTGIGLAEPARIVVPCHGIRPAPTLARAAAAAPPTSARRDGDAMEQPSPSSTADPRRLVAALLLVVGAAVVGGAGGALRWMEARGAAPLAAAAGVDPDGSPVPTLALVRLRRDGGA